jgi:glycosyltransferase involved in cell wall biosynthesis
MNILFAGHDLKFARLLIDHCERNRRHRVSVDHTGGHKIKDESKSLVLLQEADLIFCEWGLGNAEFYSKYKYDRQKLIVRIHEQELTLPFLDRIVWQKVDKVIFIQQLNLEKFLGRFPFLREKCVLIYNVIDCDDLDRNKISEARYHLGLLGMLPHRKSPHIALEILSDLKKTDDRYKLFIKSHRPEDLEWVMKREAERNYYESFYKSINDRGLTESVVFEPFDSYVPQWFTKIGFILSTSEQEGSHQAIAEGMASGSVPIIRNWAGASLIYPSGFCFDTKEEAVKLIEKYQQKMDEKQDVENIRSYARERFDKRIILGRYDALFNELEISRKDEGQESCNHEMRVLHLSFISLREYYGYKARVLDEAKFLRRAGVYICLVCFMDKADYNNEEEKKHFKEFLLTEVASEVHFYCTQNFFRLEVTEEVTQEIDKPLISLIGENRFLILHGQGMYATAHLCRIARHSGARVVYDMHGILPEESRMQGKNNRVVIKLEDRERETLTESDYRIFVSTKMQEHVREKYGIFYENDIIVPCCVDQDKFQMPGNTRSKNRVQSGLENKIVIAYAGSMSEWQWPEMMFSMFKKLSFIEPKVFLLLIVNEKDNAKIRELAVRYRIAKKKYLLKNIPSEMIGDFLGLADLAFLLRKDHPVNRVSSPVKFGEYLAAGLPVFITPWVGDYSGIVSSQGLGVSLTLSGSGFNWMALLKMIYFIKKYKKQKTAIRKKCISAARQELNFHAYGREYYKMYTLLTGEKG